MEKVTVELTLEQLRRIRTAIDTEYIRLEEVGTIRSYEKRAQYDKIYDIIADAIGRIYAE